MKKYFKHKNKLNSAHSIKWGGTDNTMIPTMQDVPSSDQQTGQLGPGYEQVVSGRAVRLYAKALPAGVESMNTTIRVTGKTTGATWLIGVVIKNGEPILIEPPLTPLPNY